MLIDHGADAVKKQPWRREGYFSPLQLAAAYMQKKVFMLLLHYDLACRDVLEHVVWLADLRSWTRDGSTFYRSVDEEDGAEFHDRDEAIVDIRIRMARALLMRGILLHHPLHLKLRISTRAQDSVHRAIILHTFTPATFGFKLLELIISLGADVNLAQSYGLQMTPLHRAISYFDVDVTKLLLAAGANPNIPDRKGFLALGRLVTVLQQYSFSPDVYYRILERGGSMASFHQAFQTPESPFEHVIRATMDLADVLLSARTVHWNAVLIKDIKIALEIWKEDLAAGLKKRI